MSLKKIERPDPHDHYLVQDGNLIQWFNRWFNRWFTEHIEPHNKLLESAVEVYGCPKHNVEWTKNKFPDDTHRAYLIGITPLKQTFLGFEIKIDPTLKPDEWYIVAGDPERAQKALKRESGGTE